MSWPAKGHDLWTSAPQVLDWTARKQASKAVEPGAPPLVHIEMVCIAVTAAAPFLLLT